MRNERTYGWAFYAIVALVLLAALVCGVWECASALEGPAAASASTLGALVSNELAGRLLDALAYAVEASLVEEALFRGVAFLGPLTLLAERNRTAACRSRSLAVAALASSLLFGLCHLLPESTEAAAGVLSAASANAGGIAVLVVQAVLKVLQAILFGCIMCAFAVRSRYFEKPWPHRGACLIGPLLLHFAYDLLCFGPSIVAGAPLPGTYLTGSAADIPPLAVSAVLLAMALLPCYHALYEQK